MTYSTQRFNLTSYDAGQLLFRTLTLRAKLFPEYATQRRYGMEFDQFDTPAADYYTVFDVEESLAVGCMRLITTNYPYMLKSLWADCVPRTYHLPSSERWAEVSRFGGPEAVPELIRALVAYARDRELDGYIFVAKPRLIRSLLGVPVLSFGLEVEPGVYPCAVSLNPEVLRQVEAKY